jgi:tRNA modification GTPase
VFSTIDTIAAVATPAGRGGIGVVRLSGPGAHAIARQLTARARDFRPRYATFAEIVEPPPPGSGEPGAGGRGRVLDQVIVTFFAAPRSFTGDDVVEISAHGSPVLLRRIVELAMAAGARLAEPGEFTLRAHLNGRLDLVQAEAIADLVDAVTPLQARAAMDQLEGTLTTAIREVDARMFDLAARLEASLDFPEEGFHFVTREQAAGELVEVQTSLEALIRDGRAGRVVRDGSLVVMSGRPNAGKSSLFNALVGAARAIVTDVPGTTRDLVTERVDIGGVPVTLIDTAGLREAADAIEIEGVRRARQAQEIAALTIDVIDGSEPLPADDRAAPGPVARVIAINKTDLPRAWPVAALGDAATRALDVSALTGAGIDALRHRIVSELTSRDEWRDPPAVSNLRHLGHLMDALAVVERTRSSLQRGATEELLLAELLEARRSLEEITGRRAPEDLLRHIFGKFCIGK